MRAILAVTLLIVGAQCVPLHDSYIESQWQAFKTQFRNNVFNGGANEEALRRQIFVDNLRYIEAHNAAADKGLHTFRLGVNQFTDMTNQEYRQRLGLVVPAHFQNTTTKPKSSILLPESIDWRTKNAVTDVKDQGQCGSCFAFATTESIEGAYAIDTGNLVILAPKQILDCIDPSRDVCSTGGNTVEALQLIIDEGGIEKESDYPYEPQQGDCQFQRSLTAASIQGVHTMQNGDEDELKEAVGTYGPVVISIDASQQSFQSYDSGVYVEPYCQSGIQNLDHAVLAVGYGSEDGQDYWLVKNSWDTTWGDSGYIKMARNQDNQCGVATYAVYPTGAK